MPLQRTQLCTNRGSNSLLSSLDCVVGTLAVVTGVSCCMKQTQIDATDLAKLGHRALFEISFFEIIEISPLQAALCVCV